MTERCNGISEEESATCCSDQHPCSEGMGDCDSDFDCERGLRCGVDNCHKEFFHQGSNWTTHDDCCTGKKPNEF